MIMREKLVNHVGKVTRLGQLFKDKFHFETESFEMPKWNWETPLRERLSGFQDKYDSPGNLAVIFYDGHAEEIWNSITSLPVK